MKNIIKKPLPILGPNNSKYNIIRKNQNSQMVYYHCNNSQYLQLKSIEFHHMINITLMPLLFFSFDSLKLHELQL